MGKGRITLVERNRRLKLLLEFVFIFRYATRKQLLKFVQNVMKLSYSRWLIEDSLRQGYLRAYYAPQAKAKIYYLTERAKNLVYEHESLIEYYRFDKRYTGKNSLLIHDIHVESYFAFNKDFGLNIQDFLCGWLLRNGRKRKERQPDAMAILPGGLKLAIEAQTSPKKLAYFKRLISFYRYHVEKDFLYHAVLVIACDKDSCEGIKKRLFYLGPELCKRVFMFTDLGALKLGGCFYQDAARDIKEAVSLLREKGREIPQK